jgi:hypothetical protein
MLRDPAFFEVRPAGINCLSGFVAFGKGGPDLWQRHVIAGWWEPGSAEVIPEGSLLARLLRGSFEGDDGAEAKIDLLGEISGAAALGYGPKLTAPKSVVLLGRTAENVAVHRGGGRPRGGWRPLCGRHADWP